MTVAELIVELQKLPQDMKVVRIHEDYEQYTYVRYVEVIELKESLIFPSLYNVTVKEPDFKAVTLD